MIVYFIQDTENGFNMYQGEAKETENMWILKSPVGGRKKIFRKDPLADSDKEALLDRYMALKEETIIELEHSIEMEQKRINIVEDLIKKGI